MTAIRWSPAQRAALVTALRDAGPDAPTSCAGWRSRHLAAHVVLRESSLLAAGIVVPALADRTDRAIAALARSAQDVRGFTALVDRLAAGPPAWSPVGWAGDAANLLELFVHTEDVRRGDVAAQVSPRDLPAAETAALWDQLTRRARMLYRRAAVGIVLVVPDGPRHLVRRPPAGQTSVVLRGEVSELILHVHGRRAVAQVCQEGGPGSADLDAALP